MYGFLSLSYSNFVRKKRRFSIRLQKNVVTLKSGSEVIKVLGTDTDRSATYDFLLTFRSNHELI